MELSPTLPSFLDMRNAIIQADVVGHGGAHVQTIWRVFAHRGMGFFAGTVGGNDVSPVEDFSLPPATGSPKATVSGVVSDRTTGKPVAHAIVAFGGHDSGLPGSYADRTDAHGRYTIHGVFFGRYPDVYADAPGYATTVRTVRVDHRSEHVNFRMKVESD
jgi:protocatechuate 3,4-dioxygenase beta subunit